MKKILLVFILCFISTIVVQAKDDYTDQYEIELAEVGAPGTLVVRVWCYGKKPNIQDDLYKENAIKGILFRGVSDSGRMKGRRTLVTDGYDSHRDYFDNFFKEKRFNNYARIALDGYVEQNSIIKVKKLYKVAKIVVISYNEIRKQLEDDKIIRGLSSGF